MYFNNQSNPFMQATQNQYNTAQQLPTPQNNSHFNQRNGGVQGSNPDFQKSSALFGAPYGMRTQSASQNLSNSMMLQQQNHQFSSANSNASNQNLTFQLDQHHLPPFQSQSARTGFQPMQGQQRAMRQLDRARPTRQHAPELPLSGRQSGLAPTTIGVQKFSFGEPAPRMPNTVAPPALLSMSLNGSHQINNNMPDSQGPIRRSQNLLSSTREERMRVPHFAKPFRVQVDKLNVSESEQKTAGAAGGLQSGGRSGSLFQRIRNGASTIMNTLLWRGGNVSDNADNNANTNNNTQNRNQSEIGAQNNVKSNSQEKSHSKDVDISLANDDKKGSFKTPLTMGAPSSANNAWECQSMHEQPQRNLLSSQHSARGGSQYGAAGGPAGNNAPVNQSFSSFMRRSSQGAPNLYSNPNMVNFQYQNNQSGIPAETGQLQKRQFNQIEPPLLDISRELNDVESQAGLSHDNNNHLPPHSFNPKPRPQYQINPSLDKRQKVNASHTQQSQFDEKRLIEQMNKMQDEKLEAKLIDHSRSIVEEIMEQMKSQMVEVMKEEAEKFYKNQSILVATRSECSSQSPGNASRRNSANGIAGLAGAPPILGRNTSSFMGSKSQLDSGDGGLKGSQSEINIRSQSGNNRSVKPFPGEDLDSDRLSSNVHMESIAMSRQPSKMQSDIVSGQKENSYQKVHIKNVAKPTSPSLKSTADNSKQKPADSFLIQPSTAKNQTTPSIPEKKSLFDPSPSEKPSSSSDIKKPAEPVKSLFGVAGTGQGESKPSLFGNAPPAQGSLFGNPNDKKSTEKDNGKPEEQPKLVSKPSSLFDSDATKNNKTPLFGVEKKADADDVEEGEIIDAPAPQLSLNKEKSLFPASNTNKPATSSLFTTDKKPEPEIKVTEAPASGNSSKTKNPFINGEVNLNNPFLNTSNNNAGSGTNPPNPFTSVPADAAKMQQNPILSPNVTSQPRQVNVGQQSQQSSNAFSQQNSSGVQNIFDKDGPNQQGTNGQMSMFATNPAINSSGTNSKPSLFGGPGAGAAAAPLFGQPSQPSSGTNSKSNIFSQQPQSQQVGQGNPFPQQQPPSAAPSLFAPQAGNPTTANPAAPSTGFGPSPTPASGSSLFGQQPSQQPQSLFGNPPAGGQNLFGAAMQQPQQSPLIQPKPDLFGSPGANAGLTNQKQESMDGMFSWGRAEQSGKGNKTRARR